MAGDEVKLREAASSGSLEDVKALLEKGVKQTPDDNGETPLHLATSSYVTAPEFVEVVRSLLDDGGEVNPVSKDGNMPIHNAASNGNMEIVELLLEYGASLNSPGEDGHLPLELAASKKHHAVVNSVVEHLVQKNTFNADQIKWMSKAKDESAQLSTYRALGSILQIKEAVPILIKLNIVDAILHGLVEFKKRSIQSHGLQLLQTVMKHPDGVAAMKTKANVTEQLRKIASENEKDNVVTHLTGSILKGLA